MIFKVAFKKNGNYLIKAIFKAEEGEKWANTTEAVYNFAQKAFKAGDEVNIEYREQNGKYFVDRITKVGGTTNKETPKSSVTEPKKEETKEYGKYASKSPETQESIIRQSTLKSACDAIQVMTGQINDVQTLGDMIETLYQRFYKIIKQ